MHNFIEYINVKPALYFSWIKKYTLLLILCDLLITSQKNITNMPVGSLYQVTKSSIQQGIFDLQQKIRRKKQLEFERTFTNDILHSNHVLRKERELVQLERINDSAKYDHLLAQTYMDLYNNPVLEQTAKYDPSSLTYEELKRVIARQKDRLDNLRRLEVIKKECHFRENQLLSVEASPYNKLRYDAFVQSYDQYTGNTSPIRQFESSKRRSPSSSRQITKEFRKSPNKRGPYIDNPYQSSPHRPYQYDQAQEESSSALIDKYNRGIKAQQYNRQMEKLIQIERRLKRVQQNVRPSQIPDAQSLVTPYRPQSQTKNQSQRGKDRYQQDSLQNHIQKQISQKGPFEIVNRAPQRHQQTQANRVGGLTFGNYKLDQVINKQKTGNLKNQSNRNNLGRQSKQRRSKSIQNPRLLNAYHQTVPLRSPYKKLINDSRAMQRSLSNPKGDYPLTTNRSTKQEAIKLEKKNSAYQKTRPRAKSSKVAYSYAVNILGDRSRLQQMSPVQVVTNFAYTPECKPIQIAYDITLHQIINQKIVKRTELSKCIFKFIERHQSRNQIDWLNERFYLESKMRSQVLKTINNDPFILRKHKMVVN